MSIQIKTGAGLVPFTAHLKTISGLVAAALHVKTAGGLVHLTGTGSAPGGPVIVSAALGTLADPISAGSTINKTTTWAMMQSLPVAATLKSFKVYATAAGTIKLKILQPIKGGAFNVISNQTLNAVIGVNTYSVSSASLAEVVMPANSIVAIHTPSTGGATVSFKSSEAPLYSAGYLAGSGDLSGNGVAMGVSAAYGNEIESKCTVEYDRATSFPGTYFIDENFSGAALPAFAINQASAPWVFAAGQATSSGTGLANFLDWYQTTNIDRCTFAVEFEFTSVADRFAIYRKPVLGDSSAAEGTIAEIDAAGNQLVFYRTWVGGTTYTLPSVCATLPLTNLALAAGVRYRAELSKTAKINSLRIINLASGAEQTLMSDNDPTNLSGLCFGRPGFANLAGSAIVKSAQFYPGVSNPRVLIVGDSITETSGTADETGYGQLTINALKTPGAGWYSGDGGTTALNVLRRLRHDLRLAIPRFVVVYIGANNAASDALTTAFGADIQAIYDTILAAGSTPVICTLTPNSSAAENARVATMNMLLLSKGWRLARFDLAISLANDGSTYAPAMMSDGVHPNTAGHAALKARLAADWPEIFD